MRRENDTSLRARRSNPARRAEAGLLRRYAPRNDGHSSGVEARAPSTALHSLRELRAVPVPRCREGG